MIARGDHDERIVAALEVRHQAVIFHRRRVAAEVLKARGLSMSRMERELSQTRGTLRRLLDPHHYPRLDSWQRGPQFWKKHHVDYLPFPVREEIPPAVSAARDELVANFGRLPGERVDQLMATLRSYAAQYRQEEKR